MGISARLQRLAADATGASAVEFAMLLPLLVALYLGGDELTQALDANRKVTELARTVSDIVSKNSEVSAVDLKQMARLAAPLLAPHDPKGAVITVVAVWTDELSRSKVDWSFAATGTGDPAGGAPAKGTAYELPQGLATPSRQTIVAKVAYPYAPTFGFAITGALNFSDEAYFAPRSGKCVKRLESVMQACTRL